jgi:hypothetical protein
MLRKTMMVFEAAALTRHVNYGVKAAEYAPISAAMLWTLEQSFGSR